MDAPLITLDPAANTTDVYAFVTQREGKKYLVTALSVYPFEEPGIGPNKYNFDDNVLYQIHISSTNVVRNNGQLPSGVSLGHATYSYQFKFSSSWKTRGTILQSYLGVVAANHDDNQNFRQSYTVTRINRRNNQTLNLGPGIVPPNNQGIATPYYNTTDNGENEAKQGATSEAGLDRYTGSAIADLGRGHRSFAGQRDDGFYGDIQAVFDLLRLRAPGKDAQQGYNVHTIVLEIPMTELGGDKQVVGVWGTTSRRQVSILRDANSGPFQDLLNKPFNPAQESGRWVQVGRQGNPLFCEAMVAIADKNLYNRSSPNMDGALFLKYAREPELARLLNALVFNAPAESPVAPETERSDLVRIFIPDVIKVDLSTGPARLAGAYDNDPGFKRLGIFEGDTLTSTIQLGFGQGTLPGGWPNGRRFGDDVVDIAVTAVASDLRISETQVPIIRGPYGDNVYDNDITYNKVFPYAATPLNGRNHGHHTVNRPPTP